MLEYQILITGALGFIAYALTQRFTVPKEVEELSTIPLDESYLIGDDRYTYEENIHQQTPKPWYSMSHWDFHLDAITNAFQTGQKQRQQIAKGVTGDGQIPSTYYRGGIVYDQYI